MQKLRCLRTAILNVFCQSTKHSGLQLPCYCCSILTWYYYPHDSEGYVFTGIGLCVCLSVIAITKKIVDGFVPYFMWRFLGGKGRPSLCFVTIGRGMWKQRSKNCVKCKQSPVYSSSLIVGVASVAKCWRQNPQILLSRGVVLSRSTFYLASSVLPWYYSVLMCQ